MILPSDSAIAHADKLMPISCPVEGCRAALSDEARQLIVSKEEYVVGTARLIKSD